MREHIIRQLDEDGYLHLPSVLPPSDLARIRRAIGPERCDYGVVHPFIRRNILDEVDRHLGWQTQYTKYRASDNNNSVDAGAIHRDLVYHSPTSEHAPVFTVLMYFDHAVVQLYPGSHHRTHMGYIEAVAAYSEHLDLRMSPGDILVFSASILHRGVFTAQVGEGAHRRVVQIFDVFPSRESMARHGPRLAHMPASASNTSSLGSFAKFVSHSPVLAPIASWLGYLHASTGYGYAPPAVDEDTMLSSEGFALRLDLQEALAAPYHQTNRYVLHPLNHLPCTDLDPAVIDRVSMYRYTAPYTVHGTVLALLVFLILYALYSLIKRKS